MAGKQKNVKCKVALPTDRSGEPIRIGDVLQWDGGERMQVDYMTYYGNGFWTAEDDGGGYSDNLGKSLIVWRGKDRR